jgi:hypothetical protein
MTTPPDSVVAAFGGDASAVTSLAGGQGQAWRAGSMVLKPAEDEPSIAWTARLLCQVPDSVAFRLARPRPAADGRWLVDGWAATDWVAGAHRPGRWPEILAVSAAVHAALRGVPVPAAPARTDPWSLGCQVAWGQRPGWQPTSPTLVALLEELAPLLRAEWLGPTAQVIHGDLGGNVLFATACRRR